VYKDSAHPDLSRKWLHGHHRIPVNPSTLYSHEYQKKMFIRMKTLKMGRLYASVETIAG